MFLTLLGILGGLLIVIADIPYAVNAYKRKTHPHRVTWLIIVLLNAISIANQSASGAKNSLLFFIGATAITSIVFVISLFRGVGGYSKLDIVVLAGALSGLALWQILGSPLASIIANVAGLSIAFIPTFMKAYYDPASETKITWIIGAVSTTLTGLSVGKLDYALLIMPVFSTFQQASLWLLIEIRERQLASAAVKT